MKSLPPLTVTIITVRVSNPIHCYDDVDVAAVHFGRNDVFLKIDDVSRCRRFWKNGTSTWIPGEDWVVNYIPIHPSKITDRTIRAVHVVIQGANALEWVQTAASDCPAVGRLLRPVLSAFGF